MGSKDANRVLELGISFVLEIWYDIGTRLGPLSLQDLLSSNPFYWIALILATAQALSWN